MKVKDFIFASSQNVINGDRLKYKGASMTPMDTPELSTAKFNVMSGVLRGKSKAKKLAWGHNALNKNKKNRRPLICGMK